MSDFIKEGGTGFNILEDDDKKVPIKSKNEGKGNKVNDEDIEGAPFGTDKKLLGKPDFAPVALDKTHE
jgi:hypothetical protein